MPCATVMGTVRVARRVIVPFETGGPNGSGAAAPSRLDWRRCSRRSIKEGCVICPALDLDYRNIGTTGDRGKGRDGLPPYLRHALPVIHLGVDLLARVVPAVGLDKHDLPVTIGEHRVRPHRTAQLLVIRGERGSDAKILGPVEIGRA